MVTVSKNRRLATHPSAWVRSFDCTHVRVLLVCRGPIRKEAIDVFREMGVERVGMLLSEKDSVVYPRALSPDARLLPPDCIHPVPDYTGATKAERLVRIDQIVSIAKEHGYTHVYAGYGFMAEDATFVAALERAGLNFMGPCSQVVDAAGLKDEAKRTALQCDVSVTPGVDDLTARALVHKHGDVDGMVAAAAAAGVTAHTEGEPLQVADALLQASYDAGVDLLTIDEIGAQAQREVAAILAEHPGRRLRLKAIGGGGGKGQRILASADDAPALYREAISEVKATGVGDNKNVLIELNIEQTRHNEIQLIGNGSWCVSMGGRDCSLQRHEQKLLEVSVTQSMLRAASKARAEAGDERAAAALAAEADLVARMEEEGERFGQAVGLDSASTFECIVDGDRHYFMEVNTRIQVEHRVSELCVVLRFRNPDEPADYFDVDSVVEMMVLLACHGPRLPRPEKVERHAASVEARLNATDDALKPHAGGEITWWSEPIEGEVRDDQGICVPNPDTGDFVRYHLAGAYDSNVALLLTVGDDRRASYEHLAEVFRRTELRGHDLSTNLGFHFGLVYWFLGTDVHARPTTRFVQAYLTMVGQLAAAAKKIDVSAAYDACMAAPEGSDKGAWRAIAASKRTLIERPVRRLLSRPHTLSAWLSFVRRQVTVRDGRVQWHTNPVHILRDTYDLLGLRDPRPAPAVKRIWCHDADLLDEALAFYDAVDQRLGSKGWPATDEALRSDQPAFDGVDWGAVRGAHLGFQAGLQVLSLLVSVAKESGFFEMKPTADLDIPIPERLQDPAAEAAALKVLSPPPAQSADTLVAVSGGMFYAQEAPNLPPLVSVGDTVEAGDPVYIVEVMKMFNKVRAPFACTIDEVLVSGDATIVQKGQPLFRVTPRERVEVADPAAERSAARAFTLERLAALG
jgi:acetyl/propionyl-CoA carboxylase alpha subunit